jgi:hypothetical protein
MDRWTSIADPDPVEAPWAVARLDDGRIVVIGSGSAADRASNVAIYSDGQLASCFWQTGYCLRSRFLDYWQNHGGLAINGFPLSDEHIEMLEDGHTYTVQYFERARFEYHPENQPPYDVLLGQFGRQILADKALLTGSLGLFYQSNQAMHDLLGRPWGAAIQSASAMQQFAHGRMYYAARGTDRYSVYPTIYVFCGDAESGQVLSSQPNAFFEDTWTEGQDPGGGPAPTPGLYYPRRGFGKVWRDNPNVQNCLGYATTPDEVGFPITVQPFGAGILLLSNTPEGRYIYVWSPSTATATVAVCKALTSVTPRRRQLAAPNRF